VLALLDTGATNSAISRELVEKLELTLIDRILVGGVHGEYFLQQYKAGFELP
jgi:predicted aspartyl protease